MASLVQDYVTRSGRKILVIDYAISEYMGNDLYEYFHRYANWSFEENEGDNVKFIHGLSNALIEGSPLWKTLCLYVRKFFGNGYTPYNCSVNHTRFGDSPLSHRDTYNAEVQDITLLLYLNPKWNMNFSGETVYFDEAGEIEFSVLPKFCRLAIHEAYIEHASRSPAQIFTGSRYTLAIKATPDEAYLQSRISEDAPSDHVMEQRKSDLEGRIFGRLRN